MDVSLLLAVLKVVARWSQGCNNAGDSCRVRRLLAVLKVVARWSQGCNNAGDSSRVGTTLLHACNQKCTDHAVYIYFTCKATMLQDDKTIKYVQLYEYTCIDTA